MRRETASASRTMVTVAALAFGIEVMIMTLLSNWGLAAESLKVILLDAAVLSVSIAPAIYWLVLFPLEREHFKRVWAEDHSMALDRLATIDPYLRILNHRGLAERLHEETSRARRYKNPLSVVRIRFGSYNEVAESAGVAAAQSLLGSAVAVLREVLRPPDLLGRLRDGELLLVLPEADLDKAVDVSQSLQLLLEHAESDRPDKTIGWRATVGAAEFDPGEEDGELVRRAEIAL